MKAKVTVTYSRVQGVTLVMDVEGETRDEIEARALMAVYDHDTPGVTNVQSDAEPGGEVYGCSEEIANLEVEP